MKNDIFNAGYMAGALGLSLCHYVLAMSSYVRGISVITPLPMVVGLALLLILSFLNHVPAIILIKFLYFLIFFI